MHSFVCSCVVLRVFFFSLSLGFGGRNDGVGAWYQVFSTGYGELLGSRCFLWGWTWGPGRYGIRSQGDLTSAHVFSEIVRSLALIISFLVPCFMVSCIHDRLRGQARAFAGSTRCAPRFVGSVAPWFAGFKLLPSGENSRPRCMRRNECTLFRTPRTLEFFLVVKLTCVVVL